MLPKPNQPPSQKRGITLRYGHLRRHPERSSPRCIVPDDHVSLTDTKVLPHTAHIQSSMESPADDSPARCLLNPTKHARSQIHLMVYHPVSSGRMRPVHRTDQLSPGCPGAKPEKLAQSCQASLEQHGDNDAPAKVDCGINALVYQRGPSTP